MSERITSASGAYMSQYDQEVENRLKSLEATVKKLQAENEQLKKKSSSAKGADAPSASADLEKRLKVLEYVVRCVEPNFDKLANKA